MTNGIDCLSKGAVDRRVREIIAKEKSPGNWEEIFQFIFLTDRLREDLNFTTAGIRQLSVPISRDDGVFQDIPELSVIPDELSPLSTVGDIAALVWAKIPPQKRCRPLVS